MYLKKNPDPALFSMLDPGPARSIFTLFLLFKTNL